MDGQAAMKNFKYLIGGQWIDASGGESFEVLNPLDDTHYANASLKRSRGRLKGE